MRSSQRLASAAGSSIDMSPKQPEDHYQPRHVILLGAGASKDAGLHTSIGLSSALRNDLIALDETGLIEQALHLVWGGIAYRRGLANKRPDDGVDVEELFEATDQIARRDASFMSAFASWHPAIERLDQAGVSTGDYVPRPRDMSFISRLDYRWPTFLERVLGRTFYPATVFGPLTHLMRHRVADLCRIDDRTRAEYLRPLIEYVAANRDRVTIATLNYDNVLHCAADLCDCTLDATMGQEPDGSGIPLLQLHGSIDWVRDPNFGARMRTPEDDGEGDPAILFGGGNKMTAEAPFLDLMWRFKGVVEDADVVTTIGYSFRDPHVNEIINSWRRWNLRPDIVGDCQLEILDMNPSDAMRRRAEEPQLRLIEASAAEGISEIFGVR